MSNSPSSRGNTAVSKLKIAIIHYRCPEKEKGGVETVIKYHALHLARAGFNVTTVYGSGGCIEDVDEVHIAELDPEHPVIKEIQGKILQKKVDSQVKVKFNRLKSIIKKRLREAVKGSDVVIVHNIPMMHFNFPATVAINELTEEIDTHFIYWIHDAFALRRKWKPYLRHWPFSEATTRLDNVTYVTITEFREKQLKRFWNRNNIKCKIEVIPNGINVNEYIKLDDVVIELKERLDIKWDDYVILMPIRVIPRKNIELGIKIGYELKKLISSGSVKLLISGPPDMNYLKKLKRLIKRLNLQDNVKFIYDLISFNREYADNKILNWGIADIYALADVVLITSKEEGFGLPLLEAGASRKPLFVTRIGPFEEILREGLEAQMFGLSEDPHAIAFKIYRYILNDIVEYNFNNIMKKYQWSSIVKEKITPLIQKVMSSSKGK